VTSTDNDPPTGFREVFDEELKDIRVRRRASKSPYLAQKEDDSTAHEEANSKLSRDLVGLSLSGGGIRSATFGLGFIQGLNDLKLLNIFDYLSTVSGGGFVGGWWTAWLSREVRKDDDEIFPPDERIELERSDDYYLTERSEVGSERIANRLAESSINAGRDPIHHLRLFANYLTPRRGALSLDTWRAITFITRNLVLTWLVLLPVLVATVLLGQLYFAAFSVGDFPHENMLKLSQQTNGEYMARTLAESFFHKPSDDQALRVRLATLRRRAFVALVPPGILASVTLFTSFLWMIGIQGGPKLLRLVNALIGLVVLVIIVAIVNDQWTATFTVGTFLFFLLAVVAVVFVVFQVPSRTLGFFRGVIRLLVRFRKASVATKQATVTKVRASVKTSVERFAQARLYDEVYLNTMTRWNARLLVILVVTSAVLAISGFGHEAVEYVCCYSSPTGTPLLGFLHYVAKSVSISGVFAAVAGLIYTGFKAAPSGGGDKADTVQPSATSRLIFAITPPLVLAVLTVVIAWLAHAFVWFIIANYAKTEDELVTVTYAGVWLSFFFAIVEIDWSEIRWRRLSILVLIVALLLIGKVVYEFSPLEEHGNMNALWSLRIAFVVGSLALFKLLAGWLGDWKFFSDPSKGYKRSFLMLGPLPLILVAVGAFLFAGVVFEHVLSSRIDQTEWSELEGPTKAVCRCGLLYLVLYVLQTRRKGLNRRSYRLVTALYVVATTLLVISFFENDLIKHPTLTTTRAVILTATAALTWVVTLGWMADPNSLSMHSFYRARLVRAYLGASNIMRAGGRKEITESVEGDDLLLSELANCRQGAPYHLINTTLNLVGGRDLATAQRSSAMFLLSKKFCGSLRTGYRPTDKYMNGEFSLGTAMAVSGAAVSPNMGSVKTTASLAMLMTLLNVRLGYWAPTPNRGRWQSAQARLWPFYTLREFLSETNDLSSYCYLTDGGHFDNTGLYSLVERGCRCVVLVDCSADPKPCFADLGTAIRRCRIDFDAEIDLDVAPLIREEKQGNLPQQHYIVGRIIYSAVHCKRLGWTDATENDRDGIIIYVKPGLLNQDLGLTADVRNYGIEDPLFPQQSTANQWFDEAEFESYRRLGAHSARVAFESFDAERIPTSAEISDDQTQAVTISDEDKSVLDAKEASGRLKTGKGLEGDVLKVFRFLYQIRPIKQDN
jgi:hypothetical protein